MRTFLVADGPLVPEELRRALSDPSHGGYCAFEGWVRNTNEGRSVLALEYEVYEALANNEAQRIIEEALSRFGEVRVSCAHRRGLLGIGELAVWVGVSSAHRHAAFGACRYIIDELKHRLPIWKKEHYADGDSAWVACTHLDPVSGGDPPRPCSDRHGCTTAASQQAAEQSLSVPLVAPPDYSRQIRLPEVGSAGQRKIRNASVLVVGAGGLGTAALTYLARAGVGRLGVVDFDHVSPSNLHRQVLYTPTDVGRPKAAVASERLSAMAPDLSVEVISGPLTGESAVDLFSRYDIVLECTDQAGSRFLSNDAALVAGRVLILASVHQWEGQLQVVDPVYGATCLRCLWGTEEMAAIGTTCEESGVFGALPGVFGTLQAAEALMRIVGMKRQNSDSIMLFSLLDGQTQRLKIDRADCCAINGSCAASARAWLERRARMGTVDIAFESCRQAIESGFRIVDIRSSSEVLQSPLACPSQQLDLSTPSAQLAQLATQQPILLVCASGKRSSSAARHARQDGLHNVFSLLGGIKPQDVSP